MNGFRFDLQKVLELRETEEKEQARALADAERQAEQARRQLAEIRAIRDEEASKLMRSHGEARAVGHLRNLGTVIDQIAEQVKRAEAAVKEAARAVDSSRTHLVEAMKERRVMDQLRDRKREAWEAEQKDHEQKQTDQLALERFQRRSMENGDTL